ncbi:hypothetical protein ACHAWO_002765 [Cyclotella atomus]|uniref:Uncharacterized protein n=1 Tax=Cyclotella atomus TaxID=382360 RepID=A0ABD3QME6_9STRA
MLQAALLTNLLFAAPEVLRPSTAPNWGHSSKKGRRPYPSSALHSESSHETESEEVPPDGFPSEWLGGWWSKYYNIMERQPHRNTELAPWAARRYRKLPGGLIEDFDHAKVEMQHKLQHPSYWRAGSGSWYNVNNQDSK